VLSLLALKRETETLYAHIDRCLEYYFLDSSETEREIESLEDYWGEYYVRASFLTRSAVLDDISFSVARLKGLYEDGNAEFVTELNGIRYRAFLVYESQVPHFRSVF
jgi:hypothetical protein